MAEKEEEVEGLVPMVRKEGGSRRGGGG